MGRVRIVVALVALAACEGSMESPDADEAPVARPLSELAPQPLIEPRHLDVVCDQTMSAEARGEFGDGQPWIDRRFIYYTLLDLGSPETLAGRVSLLSCVEFRYGNGLPEGYTISGAPPDDERCMFSHPDASGWPGRDGRLSPPMFIGDRLYIECGRRTEFLGLHGDRWSIGTTPNPPFTRQTLIVR